MMTVPGGPPRQVGRYPSSKSSATHSLGKVEILPNGDPCSLNVSPVMLCRMATMHPFSYSRFIRMPSSEMLPMTAEMPLMTAERPLLTAELPSPTGAPGCARLASLPPCTVIFGDRDWVKTPSAEDAARALPGLLSNLPAALHAGSKATDLLIGVLSTTSLCELHLDRKTAIRHHRCHVFIFT